MDDVAKEYTRHIDYVWVWLMDKYELDWDLGGMDVSFKFRSSEDISRPSCRIKYWQKDEREPELVDCTVYIVHDREFWSTYDMKTAGVAAYRLEVDETEAIVLQLVHELTHFIEWMKGNGMGEVKPTQNEVLFAFEHYYHYFKKCRPLIDKRKLPRKGNGSRPFCVIHENGIKV